MFFFEFWLSTKLATVSIVLPLFPTKCSMNSSNKSLSQLLESVYDWIEFVFLLIYKALKTYPTKCNGYWKHCLFLLLPSIKAEVFVLKSENGLGLKKKWKMIELINVPSIFVEKLIGTFERSHWWLSLHKIPNDQFYDLNVTFKLKSITCTIIWSCPIFVFIPVNVEDAIANHRLNGPK